MESLKSALFLLLFLILAVKSQAQIVNIEQKRAQLDTIGWFGTVSASMTGQRNQNNIFAINMGANLIIKETDHHWMIISEYSLIRVSNTNFSNELFGHIRYNHRLGPNVKWEAFLQVQRNVLTKLDFRGLLGTGPRFKLTDYDNARFYWGVVYMMELDETSAPPVSNYHHRLSSYFSFSLYPQEDVSFISTTYMQPRLDDWHDYRLSHESLLSLTVSKKIGLNVRFSLAYDAIPPVEVPGLTYNTMTGLTYQF